MSLSKDSISQIKTPLQVVTIIIVVIFCSEFFIMGLIRWLTLPHLATMLIDSALLVTVLTPTIYLLVYRPLKSHADTQQKAKQSIEASYAMLTTVLDSLDALVYVNDYKTSEILFLNKYGRDTFGDGVGQPCGKILQSSKADQCEFCCKSEIVDSSGQITGMHERDELNTVNQRWYNIRSRAIHWVDGRLARLEIATDFTARKQTEEERERLIAELESALSQIKVLSGVVPICLYCKEIRDDKGYWNQLETFISKHSEAEFSHSICPQCMERLHPDSQDDDEII
jgi:hypothetical protein